MRRCERVETSLAFLLSLAVVLGGCASSAARGSGAEEGDSKVEPRTAPVVVACRGELWSFELDYATGALTKRSVVSGGSGASYLALSRDRRILYVLDRDPPSRVDWFSVSADGFSLERQGGALTEGRSPPHLSLHPSGRWILVAHHGSGHVSVLPVEADGSVGDAVFVEQAVDRQAHMALSDPSGRFVFVPATGPNRVVQYRFDAQTGRLSPNDPPFVEGGGPDAQPRHLAFHPSGRFVYVINEKDSTLTSYRYDAPSGRLLDPESISTVPSEYLGDNGPAHVVVSPSGRFVYGSNRGHDSIVIYAVDPTTGRLRLVGHETAGGLIKFPRSFTLSPDGTRLLVANENSDSLLVFVVGEDGRIDPMGPPVPSGAKPSFVQVLR